MYVARLTITGFRGISSGTIHLHPHTVLVGPNNVGKTTITDALALLLGREKMIRELSEYDFTGADPSPETRIHIRGVVTGFATGAVEDHPTIFNLDRGATPMWWNPIDLRLEPTKSVGSRLAFELGYCVRFDVEELEDVAVRYFVDGDTDPFAEKVHRVSDKVLREIGMFLLPARRTWDRMLSFRSPLFQQVVAAQSAMPGTTIRALRDSLRAPESRPELQAPFSDIVARLNRELGAFLCSSPTDLQFRPTTGDSPGVLDSLHPHLVGKQGVHIPVGRHGAGVVSLQPLLLLLEFGRQRREAGKSFILVAEEPELHLHPGHHRRLVARTRGVADQTVMTTHSPEVAAFHRLDEILSLHCNESGELTATPLLPPGARLPDQNRYTKLLVTYRAEVCEALMSEVVILPEGITDFEWIRALTKESVTAEGWDTAALAMTSEPLGVLPTHEAAVVDTFRFLSPSVSGLLPLVDGDKAGSEYVKQLVSLSGEQSPPRRVVQLGTDRTIEDVVAWVLQGDTDISEVRDALDAPQLTWPDLPEHLCGRLKSRADVREELAALVGASPERAQRARRFLAGLDEIGLGRFPAGAEFRQDTVASSQRTMVWRFDPWRP